MSVELDNISVYIEIQKLPSLESLPQHWSPDSQVADKAHVSFYLQNELITKMGLPFWGSFIM